MPVLYLTEQGSLLRKEGRTIRVEKDGAQLAELELHRLDAVMVFGNVQLTTQALRALLEEAPRKRFFLEYERWMNAPWSFGGSTASPRQILRRQVEALVHAFTQNRPYAPFRFEA
jgi:CRISPR/Cas system-associated endonuclease Cas1